jgi:hypothetical protein
MKSIKEMTQGEGKLDEFRSIRDQLIEREINTGWVE